MKRCYVCATTLTSGLDSCPKCQTSVQTLRNLERAASRQRFLFGSIKAKAAPEPPQDKKSPPTATKERKESRPRVAHPKPAPSEAPKIQSQEILIQNRDPGPVAEPLVETRPLHHRGLAHLVDVILCLALNAWVLKMILLITGGSLTRLVQYSLIPLLFVLLSFTTLYFWLFIGLFQTSLGNILVRKFTGAK